MVWVTNPTSGVKSVAELIEQTRANPGKVTYGLPAYGSLNHIVLEGLRQKNNLDFLLVPYKQTAQTQTDLAGGRLTVMVDSLGASMPLIADKRIVLSCRHDGRTDAPAAGRTHDPGDRLRRSRLCRLVRLPGAQGHAT